MSENQKVIKVTRVILKVRDLSRSIEYYENVIGLKVRKKEMDRAYLTADGKKDLVVLKQPENAEPPEPGSTGLFHIALLLPARAALADLWLYLKNHPQWLAGASDHSVSEAVYLEDPDGNGIEIYADREDVPVMDMGTERLQIEELLEHATGKPWTGIPNDTVMGHIHLKVRDVKEAVVFYRDLLGFELMMEMGSSAAFMSTGGYHHHIGLNSWDSLRGSAPPDNTTGLDKAVVSLPDRETLETIKKRMNKESIPSADHQEPMVVKDPSGNTLELIIEE